MLKRLCLSLLSVGVFAALQNTGGAYDGGYYDHVARRAYYDGYGQGPYVRYGNGSDPEYGNGSYGFGYGPYGYGYGSYASGYFPSNTYDGPNYNGNGSVDYFGRPYGSAYSPYGSGVYSSY